MYAPNSYGGPHADPSAAGDDGLWAFDGQAVRAGYIEHPEDGDFTQAGTLVREVLDDAARERLVSNIVGHALDGVSEASATARLRVLEERRRRSGQAGRRRCTRRSVTR